MIKMEYNPYYKPEWLEVIAACMFSGKSDRLIERLEKLRYHKQGSGIQIGLYKPKRDTRSPNIYTRSGREPFEAELVDENNPKELLWLARDKDVVGIDEGQFFDESLVEVVHSLRAAGKNVVVAGLDTDFTGKGYRSMPQLIFDAHEVMKPWPFCMYVDSDGQCGRVAQRTQRLLNGRPAPYDDPLDVVQDSEGCDEQGNIRTYEARCIYHHFVPGKPKQ